MKNINKSYIVTLIIFVVILIVGGIAYHSFKAKNSAPAAPEASMNDGDSIKATVDGLLTAAAKVETADDAQKLIQTYYTPEAVAQFQASFSKLAPDSSQEQSVIQALHSFPNPSELTYISSIVASSTATANYIYDQSSQGTSQTLSLTAYLDKIDGRWLVSKLSFNIKS